MLRLVSRILPGYCLARLARVLLLVFLLFVCFAVKFLAIGMAQDSVLPKKLDPMAVAETVNELETKLLSESLSDRDEAEKKLIALGPVALEFLPPTRADMTADVRARLKKIRKELESQLAKSIGVTSKVSIQGKKELSDLLAQIEAQTGNHLQVMLPKLDIYVECDWQDESFWNVVNDLLERLDLFIDKYNGDGKQLILTPRPPKQHQNLDQVFDRFRPVRSFEGAIALEVERVDTSVNLANPELSGTAIEVTARWEPRLTPVELEIPYDSLVVIDDSDTPLEISKEGSIAFPLQPEFTSTEFVINLPLIPSGALRIKSLEGVCRMRVTGRRERFEFDKVDEMERGFWQEYADSVVTFDGIRTLEDLFQVRVLLQYSGDKEGLESYHSWALDNPGYLLAPDGRRIDPFSLETYAQDGGTIGIGYIFAEIPKQARFIYETPSCVFTVESKFRFENIPLR